MEGKKLFSKFREGQVLLPTNETDAVEAMTPCVVVQTCDSVMPDGIKNVCTGEYEFMFRPAKVRAGQMMNNKFSYWDSATYKWRLSL